MYSDLIYSFWKDTSIIVARKPTPTKRKCFCRGQGKTSGGRPSVTFKSWPTKGQPTRNHKRNKKFILK